MDKRKTGIALFITLMVIASIMSIIAVSFTYLEKVQKDAGSTSALIQANLLYSDTVAILKRVFPPATDNGEKLAVIYTMPMMLTEDKSGFSINLTCKPLMVAAPITWLDPSKTKKMPEKTTITKEVLANVMALYEIEDPSGLEELILEAITGKRVQNLDYEPRLQQQKGIVSRAQFNQILLTYAFMYDDQKALTIPWEKYFSFVPIDNRTKIDGHYLSPEFISMAFDIPIEIVQDGWVMGESTLSTFLQENGIVQAVNNKIYSQKALNSLSCEETFAYKEEQYTYKFNYIEGRSTNFEFNGH
ncbi:MAG TPA: hypothetical protein ENK82_04615 [Campylobacterales bacterium]|nr:hypothetical protein [Campylobacterales bacterium]HHS92607.1 hypothetical protein [Campylobacterales bacterium]